MEPGTVIPFPESVRTRPGMYFGGRDGRALARIVAGVTRILARAGSTFVRINIGAGNKVSVSANKAVLTASFFEVPHSACLPLSALPYVCQSLSIHSTEEQLAFVDGVTVAPEPSVTTADVMRISFVPHKAIFGDSVLHYSKLVEELFELCLHYPQLQVVVRDNREKYHQQNYLHCPRGIAHLAEEMAAETVGGTYPIATMETTIDDVLYKIAATWSHSWNPQSLIASFENERVASDENEVITTIMVGMGDVLRAFIKQLPDKQHRYIPRKLRNGLILLAGKYEGQDHEPKEIMQPMHNKKLREFVKGGFFSHILDNPDFLNFMLRRFDTTNPGAVMY